ncbi:MAG: hypothetical protein VW378_03890 [bacterium]
MKNYLRIVVFSFLYKFIRLIVVYSCYFFQQCRGRLKDLELAIDCGDKITEVCRRSMLCDTVFSFDIPDTLGVCLYDLYFPSPLTFSSFKSHVDTLDIWMALGAGGGCFKTILLDSSEGNKRPRIVELTGARRGCFLNAMGLPGKGVDQFLEELPQLSIHRYRRPLGFSLWGHDVRTYQQLFDRFFIALSKVDFPYYYELNLSCPNMASGITVVHKLDHIQHLLRYIRSKTQAVVGVKVSPDFDNDYLCQLMDVLRTFDKVFINCGNTRFKTLDSLHLEPDSMSVGHGGLSGALLFNRTLEMTGLLNPFGIPIMATGGISSCDHVSRLRDEGAVLFGIATALIFDPFVIPKIHQRLV